MSSFAPYEKVLKAYEMHAQGVSLRQIGREVGCEFKTVHRWIQKPDLMSPYVDWVAVDRAVAGTISHKDLTHWEREKFFEAVGVLWKRWEMVRNPKGEDPQSEGWVRYGDNWKRIRDTLKERQFRAGS